MSEIGPISLEGGGQADVLSAILEERWEGR